MKKNLLREYENIEREFFEIDDATKTATFSLRFDSPKDIFETNCLSKIPLLTLDFNSWISEAFDSVPRNYKVDLDIEFKDMEGYTPEQLKEYFDKNTVLSVKNGRKQTRIHDRLAVLLILIGFAFLIGMLLMRKFWTTNDFWHDAFFYVLDIATTVLFWEAAGILLVESSRKRLNVRRFATSFGKIEFRQSK